jgi:hypothetical protein
MSTKIILALAAAVPLLGGCTVYDQPNSPPSRGVGVGVGATVTTDDYEPDYYQGNPVYYENDEPYVIVNDQVQYVPRDRPEYNVYLGHYRGHREGYRRWHEKHPPRRGHRDERHEEHHEEHNDRHHDRD